MGGINSLSGLNNVNVDFRPAITTNVQKSGNANQLLPEANVAPEEAPQEMGKAKSVVRELDVLLLNAAASPSPQTPWRMSGLSSSRLSIWAC